MQLTSLVQDGDETIVLTGVLEANGEILGDTLDLLNYSLISLQLSGTFVGTATFEVSNDGVNWVAKNLISSTGSLSSTASSVGLYSGDLGARFFRVRVSAYTSGSIGIAVTAMAGESQYNPIGTQTVTVSGSPSVVLNTTSRSARLSTTNLGASASYTGATVDMGTTVNTYDSRVRPVVRHLAGLTPGHLQLQESLDGTTWFETRRTPVPSDGLYHTFDWPIHYRYWRLVFINGSTAQTGFDIGYSTVRGDGSSIDIKNVLPFILTQTALAISASFTGPILDLGGNQDWNVVRAFARSDQGGSYYISWSDDGTNFWIDGDANPTVPVNIGKAVESKVQARYCRLVYTNGATAQTAFRCWMTLVSL